MRRLARGAIGLVAGLSLVALGAGPASAHALGQVYNLPVPLTLYLAGAGTAVAASFVVSVLVVKPAGTHPGYPMRAIPGPLATTGSILLRVLGLIVWVGTIAAGWLVDPISPLPALLFWIGIWVGVPIAALALGNPWPSMSPFRTLYGTLEQIARLVGLERLDAGLRYPPGLARWPAVAFLFAAGWCELVLIEAKTPAMVANLLVGYTLVTLTGMILFGRVAWLRNAELFEVLYGWFGRIGPVGRRAADPELCDGCGEGCNPARCIDCPECAVVAEPGELQVELRPWFTGLAEVQWAGWSDAAFIVLALAIVTYDGLSETAFWGGLLTPVFTATFELIGPVNAVLLVQTGGLAVVWLVFMAAFGLASSLTRSLHDPDTRAAPLGRTAGAYAATLLPIAGGYLIAHYLTVLVQGVIWLPALLADPLLGAAPPLDWMPAAAVWYLSVGAIVLGHVVAVVLAHRLALREAASRPILAGLPLVALMVSYTVLSLWIIAAPLTLEPGVTPAAMLLH
jgi:hypothetical protein